MKPILMERRGQTGYLKETQVERGLKWVWKLALLSRDGRWLYTAYWNLNQSRRAINDLSLLGWKVSKADEGLNAC